MSRSLNKAIIIGNLGSDPEIRTISSGTRVANFSVATSRRWTSSAGEQQEKTEWHRIVAWDKLADIAERYLKKGERIYIEGEIEYRSYEDKDGVTKYMTEIRAREMIMLGGREGAGGGYGGDAPQRDRAPAEKGRTGGAGYEDFQAPPLGDEDDDLPF
ncbi:single-stranded DNA-binding protein [soil metagenome]